MKILLLGKYPPMQGGISAKTYWLYKQLEKNGFEYRVITPEDRLYSIPDHKHDESKVTVVKEKEIPWHIPESSLLDDRLINAALKVANDFTPDLIETNYLWPFCKDALFIAQTLSKPLLIRHAGSDILKFYKEQEFRDIMGNYFNQASAIATNTSSVNLLEDICDNTGKIQCMTRYIPAPSIFKPEKPAHKYDILFAGKINYHWHLKGLKLLLELIRQKELKALFLIGGRYEEEIHQQITEKNLGTSINVSGFVTPDKMPALYNSCKFVWCWEEEGGIEDFSNIIWEAVFCNTPCILNSKLSGKIEAEGVVESFAQLLYQTDERSLADIDFNYPLSESIENIETKTSLYNKYMADNKNLYQSVIEGEL